MGPISFVASRRYRTNVRLCSLVGGILHLLEPLLVSSAVRQADMMIEDISESSLSCVVNLLSSIFYILTYACTLFIVLYKRRVTNVARPPHPRFNRVPVACSVQPLVLTSRH